MKEEEIRKRDVLDRYLSLVAKDVEDIFDPSYFVPIECPACQGKKYINKFNKIGFQYVLCQDCQTLFANPRPNSEMLHNFYTRSASANFWINDFFKPVEESRREKIFKPRAEYIAKFIGNNKKITVCDIGAGFGLFLEELRKILPYNDYFAIEPSAAMADICKNKKINTEVKSLEQINNMEERFDIISAFELLEHVFSPRMFLEKIYCLLKPNGYLVLTTLNNKGFDIMLLGHKSKSIYPPHHINFFNPYSIQILLKALNFEIVEVSTPGKLDWSIIEGMINNKEVDLGEFWKEFSKFGSLKAKKELQTWIAANNLSSHMRVIAKKTIHKK